MDTDEKKDITVAQRQVMILSILSENPVGYSVTELLERVNRWGAGAKKRTIVRDIDELSLSYAIVEEERNGDTYYKAQKFNMKNVDLTVSDMVALSFMKKLMKTYGNIQIGKDAMKILDKIEDGSGKLNKEFITNLSQTLFVDDETVLDGQVEPEVEKIIRTAIDTRNVVEIDYYDWKNETITTRKIHPLRLKVVNKRMSVESYCELRQAIRSFRLSRIRNVRVLNENFEIPEDYTVNNNSSFIYLSGDKVEDIKLEFYGDSAKFIQEYDSDKADRITKIEDGILFEKRAALSDEVVRYVLSFGMEAKVIAPQELIDEVDNQIMNMFNGRFSQRL